MLTKRLNLFQFTACLMANPLEGRGVMKVLMGIDNSKFSEDVIRAVVTQYRPENTEVLVLHVLEPISLLAPPEMAQGYAPELEEQKKPAHALVEGIAKELREAGFKAHTASRRRHTRCLSHWSSDVCPSD